MNHCGAGCVGVFVVLGGWQGGPSCEGPGVTEERDFTGAVEAGVDTDFITAMSLWLP